MDEKIELVTVDPLDVSPAVKELLDSIPENEMVKHMDAESLFGYTCGVFWHRFIMADDTFQAYKKGVRQ